MSVRTKILVTIATVATMTAIGTTKAYGLESNLLDNTEKVQASVDETENEQKNINAIENIKTKAKEKKDIETNINKEKKDIILQEEHKKNIKDQKENKNILKNEENTDEKEKMSAKLSKENLKTINEDKQMHKKLEAIVGKEKVAQSNNQEIKQEKKENEIVDGKIVNVVSKVIVRENPSSNSLMLGELSLGESIKVDKKHSDKDWYGILFGEHGGFIPVKYIEIKKDDKNEEKNVTQVKVIDKKPVFKNLEDDSQSNIVTGQVIEILSKLNIRENPSLDSVIIGQLSSNEKVKIDKKHSNSEWYGICFGEHGGFVSSKYIKADKIIIDDNKHEDKKEDHKEKPKDVSEKKDEHKDVTKDKSQSNFVLGEVINVASYLNVREKATRKCETIGKIYEGNQVLINKAKSADGWYEIAFGSNGGYVSSDYIRIIKTDYLITDGLVKFVATYEGYSATAYRGADYQNRTIGYGHVIMPGETYSNLTEPEAKNLLKSDLNVTATQVKKVLDKKDIKLNTHQFDSLVSFAYNCGVQGLANSRLIRDIENKADLAEIKDAFLAWRHCNGVELEGLRRRRVEEFEMYSKGDYIRDLI